MINPHAIMLRNYTVSCRTAYLSCWAKPSIFQFCAIRLEIPPLSVGMAVEVCHAGLSRSIFWECALWPEILWQAQDDCKRVITHRPHLVWYRASSTFGVHEVTKWIIVSLKNSFQGSAVTNVCALNVWCYVVWPILLNKYLMRSPRFAPLSF